MSENPKRAWLHIQWDLETFVYQVTGEVPNINISLAMSEHLARVVRDQWEQAQGLDAKRILPGSFLRAFKAGPE